MADEEKKKEELARREAFAVALTKLMQEHRLMIAAEPYLTPEGRILARPVVLNRE